MASKGSNSNASALAASTGFGSGRGQNGKVAALQATTGYRTSGSGGGLSSRLTDNGGASQPTPKAPTPGAPQSGQALIDTAVAANRAMNGG